MDIVSRVGLPVLLAAFIIGCGRTAPIVTMPDPVPSQSSSSPSFLSGSLPGVDSLVIQDVLETFDSTFVDATTEFQVETKFLEGQQLVASAESILTVVVGPSVLADSASTVVDVTAFESAVQGARQVLSAAAQAQAAQDSTQAQFLLANAQTLLEEAVSLNPRHEESQYQLAQVYSIRASYFREQVAWQEVLEILRGLVALRANEHGLWAEIALALQNLERFDDSAVLWLRSAQTVFNDAELSFEDAPLDSALIFTYSVRAYRAFLSSRNADGVNQSLVQALQYTRSVEEYAFALQELAWIQWDGSNLRHRLTFDSLRQVATENPIVAMNGLEGMIPALSRPAARWETVYNYAVLSHQNGFEDRSLDSLNVLWNIVADMDSSTMGIHQFSRQQQVLIPAVLPYPSFPEDVRSAYATVLYDRALSHRQSGRSALAFTYFIQLADLRTEYTARAYIEAIRLARYNPEQALQIEPRFEEQFATFAIDDQLEYLIEIGNLYRRLGRNDEARIYLNRFRTIRDQN